MNFIICNNDEQYHTSLVTFSINTIIKTLSKLTCHWKIKCISTKLLRCTWELFELHTYRHEGKVCYPFLNIPNDFVTSSRKKCSRACTHPAGKRKKSYVKGFSMRNSALPYSHSKQHANCIPAVLTLTSRTINNSWLYHVRLSKFNQVLTFIFGLLENSNNKYMDGLHRKTKSEFLQEQHPLHSKQKH